MNENRPARIVWTALERLEELEEAIDEAVAGVPGPFRQRVAQPLRALKMWARAVTELASTHSSVDAASCAPGQLECAGSSLRKPNPEG